LLGVLQVFSGMMELEGSDQIEQFIDQFSPAISFADGFEESSLRAYFDRVLGIISDLFLATRKEKNKAVVSKVVKAIESLE
jgi:hypothetical protein